MNNEKIDVKRSQEATEVRFLRRRLRIHWTVKMMNRECVTKANVERNVIKLTRKRQLAFIKHTVRKGGHEYIITGKINWMQRKTETNKQKNHGQLI